MVAEDNDKLPLIVATTGHRNLVASEVDGIRGAIEDCLGDLVRRYPQRQVVLLSGLAEGADQVAADAAHAVGCGVVAVLPMTVDDYRRDFVDEAALAAFERQLAAATQVIELPTAKTDSGALRDPMSDPREHQYAQLGVYLAAHCHLLLAIWDGKPSDQLGGTAQVVAFHQDDIMPGYTDPIFATRQMLIDDESDLVYHIVCSRDGEGGAPADGLEPLQCWWLSKDALRPRSEHMPGQHERIFARSAEFSADAARFATHIDANAYPLFADAEADRLPAGAATIDRWFRAADVLAMHFQRRVLWTLRIAHVLAFLMGTCFILYADVATERAFMIAFLLLFGISAVIQQVAKRRGWHRKYLDYRALAEGLRVQFYWAAAGVADENAARFPHDNFLRSQEPELGWIRNVMRAAGLVVNAQRATPASGLTFTLDTWLGDDEQGQLAYFARRTEQRERRHRLTEALGLLSLLTSVVMISLFVLAGGLLPDDWIGPLLAVMGALLLAYAIREGYAYALAEQELIKQYRFMLGLFSSARERLLVASNDSERRQLLRALGRAALDEHSEWLMLHRSRAVDQKEIWRLGS